MTPAELSQSLLHAVRCAVADGELPAVDEALLRRFTLAPPRPGGYGDYASNAPLQLASRLQRPAPGIARALGERLLRQDGVREVRVSGPGFLNIALDAYGRDADLVRAVARDGLRHGYGDSLAGQDLVLRVPGRDTRGRVVADVVVRLVAAQGGRARVREGEGEGEGEPLRTAAPAPARALTPPDLPPSPLPPSPQAVLGADALRWDLLYTAAGDRPRLDPAVLLLQRVENPLFRVRYAHSRARALVREAGRLGFAPEAGETGERGAELVRVLGEHGAVLRLAAARRAPERLARHLVHVADALLDFHDRLDGLLPLGGRKPSAAHRSRLALAEAAGTVLAGGLSLLGVSAPEFV